MNKEVLQGKLKGNLKSMAQGYAKHNLSARDLDKDRLKERNREIVRRIVEAEPKVRSWNRFTFNQSPINEERRKYREKILT